MSDKTKDKKNVATFNKALLRLIKELRAVPAAVLDPCRLPNELGWFTGPRVISDSITRTTKID